MYWGLETSWSLGTEGLLRPFGCLSLSRRFSASLLFLSASVQSLFQGPRFLAFGWPRPNEEIAELIASVSISTPSSMVVVGLSWDSTLALSMRREAAKSSFLSSSCFFVNRGVRGGGSEVTREERVAVNEIGLWSDERRLRVFQLLKVTAPLETIVTSMAEEGTHLVEPGKADLVNDPSLRIRDVLVSERTASASTLPEGLAREACPQEGCLALKSPPMQNSAPERALSTRGNQFLNSLLACLGLS